MHIEICIDETCCIRSDRPLNFIMGDSHRLKEVGLLLYVVGSGAYSTSTTLNIRG